jgi:hypothetical protein
VTVAVSCSRFVLEAERDVWRHLVRSRLWLHGIVDNSCSDRSRPVPSAASGWAGPVSGKGTRNGPIPLTSGVARTLDSHDAAVDRNRTRGRSAANPQVAALKPT